MKKSIYILVLSAIIGCNPETFDSYSLDYELAHSIDSILSANYPADEPGAAIIITKEGKELYKKGFGLASMEFNVPMKPEMIFRVGSITKQFTAVSILMLEEMGKLSVGDDIRIHLPDYPSHGEIITIENLLTHTSGIPSFTNFENIKEIERTHLTTDEILSLFKDKPLHFKPGDHFTYNNSGYALLGAIIESVSGMSYEDFVEKNIFQKLGMSNSFYDHPEEVIQNKIWGYDKDSLGYKLADYMTMCAPSSAGALRSNVDDLALWNKAIHEGELLPIDRLGKAFVPFLLNSGKMIPYGFGWYTHPFFGHTMYNHSGEIYGFRTSGIYFPDEDIYIAILSNNESSSADYVSVLVAYEMLNIKINHVVKTFDDLENYSGIYQDDNGNTLEINRDTIGLVIKASWIDSKLTPVSDGSFIIEDLFITCDFKRVSSDSIESMRIKHIYFGGDYILTRMKN